MARLIRAISMPMKPSPIAVKYAIVASVAVPDPGSRRSGLRARRTRSTAPAMASGARISSSAAVADTASDVYRNSRPSSARVSHSSP